MRIVIDLQGCQSEGSRSRGIGRYSMALAKAMAEQAKQHELWLALNGNFLDTIAGIRREFDGCIPPNQIFVYDLPSSAGEMNISSTWRIHAAERIREYAINRLKPDVLHISSLFEGLGDSAVASINVFDLTLPTAVTLYDLIPLIRAETYLENKIVRTWYYRKIESLRQAKLLLAISENSRQEALTVLGLPEDRVVTISTAVDEHFRPIQLSSDHTQSLYARYRLNRPFVMYTGGIDSRKNIEGLIEAYANLPLKLRHNYQLAIVCSVKDHDRNRLMAITSRYKLNQDEVILTGFVPEADLVALYNLCELFVFPSLHEGFGLPALEAMSCGAAVIGSNTSSIPEVIGRSDALFDPTRIESITGTLYKGLTDSDFRQSLRDSAFQQASKFSWKSSASKALSAFERLYDQEQSLRSQVAVSTLKPKLAFVSPLPPQQSGIADYSAELLPVLAQHYDITVIVDQPKVNGIWINENLAIQSIDWFRTHAGGFERRLYQIGNSHFHQHMFDLIEKYSGSVVLHDFYLTGAINWMDTFVGPSGIFAQSLYRSHGYLALSTLFREGIEPVSIRFPANQSVLDNAAGVIVHSQYSKDIAEKWYGRDISKSWQLIPQLHAPPQQITKKDARSRLQLNSDDFIICSFGIVAPTKLNDRLLNAWLSSRLTDDPRCHLVFVGENHKGEYGQQLLAAIHESGMKDRIKITDFVNTESYGQYLAAADVAVQLRALSRGETSRAVLEAMVNGLPLVINDHGTMAGYPNDILIKLPDDFSDSQLVQAVETLYENPSLRQDLGQSGYRYVAEHHNPAKVGLLYYNAIEAFTNTSPHAHYRQLLDSFQDIKSLAIPEEEDLVAAAEAITQNTDRFGQPQLLVDISSCMQSQATLKQKTIRATVLRLLKQPLETYRTEPVYLDGKVYRYARHFTLDLLGISLVKGLDDDPVDISKQDLFLGIDTMAALTAESHRCLMRWHQFGVRTYLAVFNDVTETQDWAQMIIDIADHVLCSSAELSQKLKTQLSASTADEKKLPSIDCFELTTQPNKTAYIDFSAKLGELDKSF